MNSLMQHFFDRAIGFEDLHRQLSSGKRNFPPYNVIRDGEKTLVEVALAGYSKDDIKVVVEDATLSIEGSGEPDNEDRQHLHRGIAKRKFKTSFSLAEYVEVVSADFRDGLLTVALEQVVPEEKQPKVITIN